MASDHKESTIAADRARFEQRDQEHKRLARCRTLEMVARSKLAAVPPGDPMRPSLQRAMRVFEAKLRARELAHEEGR
jgi:hypothetical protein